MSFLGKILRTDVNPERDKNIIYTCGFKTSFPKTYAYLEFYVSVRHPDLFLRLNKKLISININLSMTECDDLGSHHKNEITLFLKSIFTKIGTLDFSKYNINNQSNLEKLIKYIDSQPRLQIVLIHEYEHYLDLDVDYKDLSGMFDLTPRFFDEISKHLSHELLYEKAILEEYVFSTDELQARLAEWIFLKVKNYDEKNILNLDCKILDKAIKDIEIRKKNIEEALLNEKDAGKIKILRKKFITNQLFFEKYSIMNRIANSYAEDIRKRYQNLQNELKK